MATTVLKARWLIDGKSDKALPNAALIIEDRQVKQVSSQNEVNVPADAEVRDFGDATILPGLVDCHTHWILDGSTDPRDTLRRETPVISALRAAGHARQTLRCGVTTIRDVGCAWGISIALREIIAAGLLEGPRVFACATFITMTGGHGFYLSRQADGPDDMRRAVREQLRDGADLIKIIASGGVYMNREDPTSAQLTLEELAAAVSEARTAGVKIALHAEGGDSINNAITVGADTIEHGIYLDEDMAKAMVEKGTVLVPTIFIFYNLAETGLAAGAPEYAVEKARKIVDVHRRGFEVALKAGVRIAAGTDVGGPLLQHHAFPLQNEMMTMVRYGMEPMDVIKSATSGAAETIGAADFGTLEPGMLADAIVVEGSPLDDINALCDVQHIVKEGKSYAPHTPSELAAFGRAGQGGR